MQNHSEKSIIKWVMNMKILMIGGTGKISAAVSKLISEKKGAELYLLNRGQKQVDYIPKDHQLVMDITDEEKVSTILRGMKFDVVADFIAFKKEDVERDFRLFHGNTKQYIFISSASVYKKPFSDCRVTEGNSLANPYWEYSRDKIACENYLMERYREDGFPVTIIRPSHTYNEETIPVGVHGEFGSWQVAKRMLEGKQVIIHGDGTSLWTLTHSSDFAKGFVGLMGNIRAIGEAVQITSDESLTWNQIYEALADALGVELHAYHIASDFLASCSGYDLTGTLLGDKAHSLVFDNTKLKRLVPDFVATKRFDEGIRESVEYILNHPELQTEDPEFDKWCDMMIFTLEQSKKLI